MEESHTPNTHSHHNSKERTKKSPHPIPEVKIQIDCSSRTSSSHNHRGASSDGTLTENSSSETPWNREAKRTKIFHPKPPRKGMTSFSLAYFTFFSWWHDFFLTSTTRSPVVSCMPHYDLHMSFSPCYVPVFPCFFVGLFVVNCQLRSCTQKVRTVPTHSSQMWLIWGPWRRRWFN